MSDHVGDAQLQSVLGRFAALADVLLRDPAAWLGDDAPGGPVAGAPAEGAPEQEAPGLGRRVLTGLGAAAGRARRLVTGRVHPGSPGWGALPVDERAAWWVARIQAVAAPVAAAPRVAGALADRVPLQGALGSAAAGLAVCAVAREHGVDTPQDWVPLLATVLFDRRLERPGELPPGDPDDDREAQAPDLVEPPAVTDRGPFRRAARGLWRLATLLWSLPGLFDERPRGALVWRAVGMLPVVGLPAGVLDERGAVRAAAQETMRLLAARTAAGPAT